jgi:hypothetical protein
MFPITNGLLSSAPTSQSTWVANYPGATMGLSSNGNTAGILWAIQRFGTDPAGGGIVANGGLHASDATSLTNELYTSAQVGTAINWIRPPNGPHPWSPTDAFTSRRSDKSRRTAYFRSRPYGTFGKHARSEHRAELEQALVTNAVAVAGVGAAQPGTRAELARTTC